MASRFAQFKKNWYAVETLPIVFVTLMAGGGATWYLTRLARGPDVVWDRKNNPTPWQNVEPGTNTKMMSVNVVKMAMRLVLQGGQSDLAVIEAGRLPHVLSDQRSGPL